MASESSLACILCCPILRCCTGFVGNCSCNESCSCSEIPLCCCILEAKETVIQPRPEPSSRPTQDSRRSSSESEPAYSYVRLGNVKFSQPRKQSGSPRGGQVDITAIRQIESQDTNWTLGPTPQTHEPLEPTALEDSQREAHPYLTPLELYQNSRSSSEKRTKSKVSASKKYSDRRQQNLMQREHTEEWNLPFRNRDARKIAVSNPITEL